MWWGQAHAEHPWSSKVGGKGRQRDAAEKMGGILGRKWRVCCTVTVALYHQDVQTVELHEFCIASTHSAF